MRAAAVALAALATACSEPRSEPSRSASDRASLEAAVANCDRGAGGTPCDLERKRLAEARRADRMAAYRQAH